MTLRQVIYRVEVPGTGTGGGPGITDSIGLYARITLTDQITSTATDTLSIAAKTTYAENNATPTDTLGLFAKVFGFDTAPGQSDALANLAIGGAEANPTPADALSALAMALTPETNATPDEAIKTGFAGSALADTSGPAVDSRPTTTVHTWASSQTSNGGGTTNGANAIGARNGTIATVTGTGLLATTSTLTLTIPVASVPPTGAKTLRCYIGYTSSLNTATVTFTNTGGVPASGTVPVANGAVIGTSTDIALTSIGTSFTVQVLVNAAALLAPTFTVDAVEIQTVSVI